jgi:hypothetical protein
MTPKIATVVLIPVSTDELFFFCDLENGLSVIEDGGVFF